MRKADSGGKVPVVEADPNDCPFREFKDTELGSDLWGQSPATARLLPRPSSVKHGGLHQPKSVTKQVMDMVWVDDQTQPLPRSVRKYLHGWIRAETLSFDRWETELVVFDENSSGRMSVSDTQLSHAQVLQRSSFCRKVLSTCYILEKVDSFVVEHQWENFTFQFGPEGWRARYHIYSPGMKSGGGPTHKPGLSKNGCYLVRLYYLGAWRCVWVNDLVPVDATDSPLLPFTPLTQSLAGKLKSAAPNTTPNVQLWPLLICKALLKLAAPDMNAADDDDEYEDEDMAEFNMMHALTGWTFIKTHFDEHSDVEDFWNRVIQDVPMFQWDDDDDTIASTIRANKSPKKPKENMSLKEKKRGVVVTAILKDSKDVPPYVLPGLTPAHEFEYVITLARDIPLKKPLPEPEVALWKTYRWIEWAKAHGLYDDYAFPRTRFLKVTALMKLSHAPHLLDLQSTESITYNFRIENTKPTKPPKTKQELAKAGTTPSQAILQIKEELREWSLYTSFQPLTKSMTALYFPSMYQYTSASRSPPIRVAASTKASSNRALDIIAPKHEPLYLQIDSPVHTSLRITLTAINPRVMLHCGVTLEDYIEPAYLLLEEFMFFEACDLPVANAYIGTRAYESVEISFLPGRHYCRIWVHSRTNWQIALLSEANLLLGSRDLILAARVVECPWIEIFLSGLGIAFQNWVRLGRAGMAIHPVDNEFYQSYLPDLEWNIEEAGCKKVLVHWMFRQAVQTLLKKQLPHTEFQYVCSVLRRYFRDPDFGMPDKPKLGKSVREIINLDPCDCVAPEYVEVEAEEDLEDTHTSVEKHSSRSDNMVEELMTSHIPKIMSFVCEYATEEQQCGVLKIEREKIMKMHEAATVLQAYWRGYRARKYLNGAYSMPADILKMVMDSAFGNLDVLSMLMNEYFTMYPRIRHAYSIASALRSGRGLLQFSGVVPVTPRCSWVPFFHGVFYCHHPVQVHLDVQSSIPYRTFTVYDNETKLPMPQVYNAHMTFNMVPNPSGYTIMGHGCVFELPNLKPDGSWHLTVLSSIENCFHICDNDLDSCTPFDIPVAYKFHVDEIFLPNRRNILGGIQFIVTKTNTVSFRVAASASELKMVAVLRSVNASGEVEVIEWRTGIGEIYWPYICLQTELVNSFSLPHLRASTAGHSPKSAQKLHKAPKSAGSGPGVSKSKSKLSWRTRLSGGEPKTYTIEVIALDGWPLTLEQWKRVDEVRNTQSKPEAQAQKVKAGAAPLKPASAKDKEKLPAAPPLYRPLPEDAYVELECAYVIGGGITAKRDDERDLILEAAVKSWAEKEPGRTVRGAHIRQEFRDAHLETAAPSRSSTSLSGEDNSDELADNQALVTPANTKVDEEEEDREEEVTYLSMPQQLKDKFMPLDFVPLCTKEITDEIAYVTLNKAEAAKQERHARIESAIQRMNDLQAYNETYVLGRQKNRLLLLDRLFVDSSWSPELAEVLEGRDDAIAQENLLRNLSSSRKKQEAKKK